MSWDVLQEILERVSPSGWDFGPGDDAAAYQQPSGWDFGPLSDEYLSQLGNENSFDDGSMAKVMQTAQPQEQGVIDYFTGGLGALGDFITKYEKPLGWVGSGLGGLAGYMSAQERNKLIKQMQAKQDAEKAAAKAAANQYGAPVKYQLGRSRIANPSFAGGQAQYFANNALSANPRLYAEGGYFEGGTKGQDDKIPAMLSDGEFVVDAETVSMLGDGNNAAGASALEQMRQNIRKEKRKAPVNKIPPKAKAPEQYVKKGKK